VYGNTVWNLVRPVYVLVLEWNLPTRDFVAGLFPLFISMVRLLNYHGLLYLLFFKFMLDAALLARVVRAHVEALTGKIHEVYQQEEKELRDDKKNPINEKHMRMVHLLIVKLATQVLPCLTTISGPTFGFAACNWAWAFVRIFHHLIAATESEMSCGLALAIGQVLAIHLPLGLLCLLPLATVSDACDHLQEQINKLRAVSDPEDDKYIRLTEAYMQGANRGQGLGYELYGTGMVVNKRVLLALFAKIAGFASLFLSVTYEFFKLQRRYQTFLKSG